MLHSLNSRKYLMDAKALALISAIALFCGLPAIAGLFTDHEARAAWENRALAKFPRPGVNLKEIHALPEKVDAYLRDHFGFAVWLNNLYRQSRIYLYADAPTKRITIGSEGFLFVTSFSGDDRYGMFRSLCTTQVKSPHIENTVPAFLALLEKYQAKGYRVALGIAPTKPGLYPEKLPDTVPKKLRRACVDYGYLANTASALVAGGKSSGLAVVYPYAEFAEQKNNGNFYPRENFHWSGRSTHLFATLMLEKLGIDVPATFHRQRIDVTEPADTANQMGVAVSYHQKSFDYSHFEGVESSEVPDPLGQYLVGEWRPAGSITMGRPMSKRTALVVGNSFTKSAVQSLAPGYAETLWFQTNTITPEQINQAISAVLAAVDISDIIFITHDHGLFRGNKLAASAEY